jgi:uncharacterized membrane protein YcaP (DUF421 family)
MSWLNSIWIVALHTAVIYLFLILLLRVAGQRQMGQLTVIDLVIIIILGSAVETSMLADDVSLKAGLTSAATLLILNRLIAWMMRRNRKLFRLLSGGPVLLIHDGRLEEQRMRRIGFTILDLEEALRERGYKSVSEVKYCIMETDGNINVIPKTEESSRGKHDMRKNSPAASSGDWAAKRKHPTGRSKRRSHPGRDSS